MSAITRDEEFFTVTISSGQAKSGAFCVIGRAFGSIQMPSAFTGTSISFEASSTEGGTYVGVNDSSNTAISQAITVSKGYRLPLELTSFRWLKIVSNGTEAADRSIVVTLKG